MAHRKKVIAAGIATSLVAAALFAWLRRDDDPVNDPAPARSTTTIPAEPDLTIPAAPPPIGASAATREYSELPLLPSVRMLVRDPTGTSPPYEEAPVAQIEFDNAEVSTGSTLTFVDFVPQLDGIPVDVEPVRLAVDSSGDVIKTRLTFDPSKWTTARRSEVDIDERTITKLVADRLGDGDVTIESTIEVWIPIEELLDSGVLVRVSTAKGGLYDVQVDAVTLATMNVTALKVSDSADVCSPDKEDSSAACAFNIDPSGVIETVEFDDLKTNSGKTLLANSRVEVAKVTGSERLKTFLSNDIGDSFDSSTVAQDDARWDGSTEELDVIAGNAFAWLDRVLDRLDSVGFDLESLPKIQVAIADVPFSALAVARQPDRLAFGDLDRGHTAQDAFVVLHELAHLALASSASSATRSVLPGPSALGEVNSDLVAWLALVDVEGSEPAQRCVAAWTSTGQKEPAPCLRDYRGGERYPDDYLKHVAAGNNHRAGASFGGEGLDTFDALGVRPGSEWVCKIATMSPTRRPVSQGFCRGVANVGFGDGDTSRNCRQFHPGGPVVRR